MPRQVENLHVALPVSLIRTRPIAARHIRPYRAAWTAKNLLFHTLFVSLPDTKGNRLEHLSAILWPPYGQGAARLAVHTAVTQRLCVIFERYYHRCDECQQVFSHRWKIVPAAMIKASGRESANSRRPGTMLNNSAPP